MRLRPDGHGLGREPSSQATSSTKMNRSPRSSSWADETAPSPTVDRRGSRPARRSGLRRCPSGGRSTRHGGESCLGVDPSPPLRDVVSWRVSLVSPRLRWTWERLHPTVATPGKGWASKCKGLDTKPVYGGVHACYPRTKKGIAQGCSMANLPGVPALPDTAPMHEDRNGGELRRAPDRRLRHCGSSRR